MFYEGVCSQYSHFQLRRNISIEGFNRYQYVEASHYYVQRAEIIHSFAVWPNFSVVNFFLVRSRVAKNFENDAFPNH